MVDASKINLFYIDPNIFNESVIASPNMLWVGPFEVGAVYRSLELIYTGGDKVVISPNKYDFNTSDHSWIKEFGRNLVTTAADIAANFFQGKDFWIYFNGQGTLIGDPLEKGVGFIEAKIFQKYL